MWHQEGTGPQPRKLWTYDSLGPHARKLDELVPISGAEGSSICTEGRQAPVLKVSIDKQRLPIDVSLL